MFGFGTIFFFLLKHRFWQRLGRPSAISLELSLEMESVSLPLSFKLKLSCLTLVDLQKINSRHYEVAPLFGNLQGHTCSSVRVPWAGAQRKRRANLETASYRKAACPVPPEDRACLAIWRTCAFAVGRGFWRREWHQLLTWLESLFWEYGGWGSRNREMRQKATVAATPAGEGSWNKRAIIIVSQMDYTQPQNQEKA